ncbi:MAG: FAD:protein FMN transferase [Candidatus Omnitrophica bacterium]|nr:FAD:protein FMN transferase [Candidatus Omnitrophota bacterium]
MKSTFSTISNNKKSKGLKEYYEVRSFFGTSVWIHCFYDVGADIAQATRACWQKAERIQSYMNVYDEAREGNLSWLNRAGYQGVRVEEDIFKVLKHAMEYSRLTGGAYDVTIFPLVQLWKNAAQSGQLPEKDLLARVKDLVGYQHVLLQEPDLVFFMKKGMMVDLGSPASGYFCDEAALILNAHNIRHFMVDGGGEIFCHGKDKGESPWRVGVQDPFDKARILMDIELEDKGISTSGNYEKFSTIGTEKFAHIIDPKTGYPQKQAASVTVIAKTTQAANELSTALCVMGGRKGLGFVRSLKDVEALIIENDNDKIVEYRTGAFQK